MPALSNLQLSPSSANHVMPPTFIESEPVPAEAGKYAGTHVLQDEERHGQALIRALTSEQLINAAPREHAAPTAWHGARGVGRM